MDDILDAFGLKFNELTLDEQNDLFHMVQVVEQKKSYSVEDFKFDIQNAFNEVVQSLAKEPEGTTNNIHLKARMMCYSFMLGVLKGPESAQEELELYIENIKKMREARR